ncbi:RraA family protein [uncultured Cohaesibacter sp.]|uniref:RraA family protein n=1 Tax=uncultured Cohaesibacter sp. TaxID=1002546 RepID=UPI0029C95A1F|nr:RraA family protein [uncultured Cohaesibacter sp.]
MTALSATAMPVSDDKLEKLMAEFATCAVANVSDNLERLRGAKGIKPFHRSGVMVGRALTIKVVPGSNGFIHRALDVVKPGDVLVVDGGGYVDRALIGEIMVAIAKSRGAAGYVIDGAIRDIDNISCNDFPVFARDFIHLGPYKDGPGALNVPVTIGGMMVHPGDIVLGDADGVVAFSPEEAEDLLVCTRAQQKKEEDILASVAAGTYTGAYAK